MMKKIALILFLVSGIHISSQTKKADISAIVAFYNVENLFDTEDDPEIADKEYLLSGEKKWDETRYENKLKNIARVIGSIRPDLIGLSEVENRKVLEDLVMKTQLRSLGYRIIHFQSPDYRGIDVAALYRQDKILPIEAVNIPVKDPENENYRTRDILYFKSILGKKDTLHFYVNHWSSRRGSGSEDKRILAAGILRNQVDSLLNVNENAKIIISGDFNDDPRNKSLKKELLAVAKPKKENELFNTSYKTYKLGYGTLMYRGQYNLFDQMIISQGLLKKNSESVYYLEDSFQVFAPNWLTFSSGEYEGAPLRTYSFNQYQNGFSDHYPVFIILSR